MPVLVTRLIALLLAAALLVPVATASAAQSKRTAIPRLTAVTCVPATASACARGVRVRIGKQVQLRGRGLKAGLRVTFRWPRGALATKLKRSKAGLGRARARRDAAGPGGRLRQAHPDGADRRT